MSRLNILDLICNVNFSIQVAISAPTLAGVWKNSVGTGG